MLGYCNRQRKIRKMVLGFIKTQEIEEDYLLDDMKPSKMEDIIFYLSFGYPLAIHLYALFSII
jgi:hypothetical protein